MVQIRTKKLATVIAAFCTPVSMKMAAIEKEMGNLNLLLSSQQGKIEIPKNYNTCFSHSENEGFAVYQYGRHLENGVFMVTTSSHWERDEMLLEFPRPETIKNLKRTIAVAAFAELFLGDLSFITETRRTLKLLRKIGPILEQMEQLQAISHQWKK